MIDVLLCARRVLSKVLELLDLACTRGQVVESGPNGLAGASLRNYILLDILGLSH